MDSSSAQFQQKEENTYNIIKTNEQSCNSNLTEDQPDKVHRTGNYMRSSSSNSIKKKTLSNLQTNNKKKQLDHLLDTFNLIGTVYFPTRTTNNSATLIHTFSLTTEGTTP
jgi:hypothetical protein